MKRRVKFIGLMTFVLALLTSCGGGDKDKVVEISDTPVEIAVDESGEAIVNMHNFEVPKELIEIDYYVTSQGDPAKDAKYSEKMNQYLLDNFNVKLNRIMYDSDPTERMNLMLASGDYPDVIAGLSASQMEKWVSQERLIDINKYIEKGHGDGVKDVLGDKYDLYLYDDGGLYGLPNGFGILPIPDVSAAIRWDYYNEIGSPNFETPEEYYEVLKQMLEKHPVNHNGEKNYAMSWYTNNNSTADAGLVDYVMGIWGLKKGYLENEDNSLTHWIRTEEGLEAALFFNQMYLDGNFDPDGFINKFEEFKEKFGQERVVGFYGDWWRPWNAGHEVWQKENPNWTDDMRMVQVPLQAEGKTAYLSPKDSFGWNFVSITDKADNVEEILKFLEWSMSDDGAKLLGWGVPNEANSNWNLEEDGSWEWNESEVNELLAGEYDYEEHYYLGGTRQWLALNQGLMEDGTTLWFDQNFNDKDKWKKMLNENMKDTIYDATARRFVIPEGDPIAITKQQIDDIIATGWANMVTSKSQEECEAVFNETRDKLEKAGLAELEEFLTTNYQNNLAKMEN